MHADLQPGRLMQAGAEIIRIDVTDYELAEAQAIAKLAGTEARMIELETREANLEQASRHSGILDKFIGDGALVVFGAIEADDNAARPSGGGRTPRA